MASAVRGPVGCATRGQFVTPWTARPPEIARLMNPAFCALVMRASVKGYCDENTEGLPYALAFLVLPLSLHQRSRLALPKTVATRLAFWVADTPHLRMGLADRVRGLVPYTKEALIFALRDPLVQLVGGRFIPAKRRLRAMPWPGSSEPSVCIEAAHLIGRLFARAGSAGTVLTTLGVSV